MEDNVIELKIPPTGNVNITTFVLDLIIDKQRIGDMIDTIGDLTGADVDNAKVRIQVDFQGTTVDVQCYRARNKLKWKGTKNDNN